MPEGYTPSSEEMNRVSDAFSKALKALGGGVRIVETRYNSNRRRIEIDTYIDTGYHIEDGFAIGQEVPDIVDSVITTLLGESGISESPLGALLRDRVYLDGVKF